MSVPHLQILTIFPEMFSGFLSASLIKKACAAGHIRISTINIRDFAEPPHYKVDDTPYGGGAGMVMRPEPLSRAIEQALAAAPAARVVLLTPAGAKFSQARARQYAAQGDLILICGRYEGVDQRVIDLYVHEELSIGDYVLMGGEVPAMVVVEATVRLMENVIGNSASLEEESFCISDAGKLLLEAPHYTKPADFKGRKVPEVLLSGDHRKVAEWRKKQALTRTEERRPDLLSLSGSSRGENRGLIMPAKFSVILMHDKMVDKQGKLVCTSLTMIDVHDLARSSCTYGLEHVFIAHPSPALRKLAFTLKGHWEHGFGATYNPNRKEALANVEIVCDLDEAIAFLDKEDGKLPRLVATSAKKGGARLSFSRMREKLTSDDGEHYLLMLGTGHGMSEELLQRADLFLEPINGPTPYNHLSVRSACAIMLDRLLGLHQELS